MAHIQAVINPTSSTQRASLDRKHKVDFLTTAAQRCTALGLSPRGLHMSSDALIATILGKQAVHGNDIKPSKEARWSMKWPSRDARRSQDFKSDQDSGPTLSVPSTSTTPLRQSSATSFESSTSAGSQLAYRRDGMASINGSIGVCDPSGIDVQAPLLSSRMPGEFPGSEVDPKSLSISDILTSPKCAPAIQYLRPLEKIDRQDVQHSRTGVSSDNCSMMSEGSSSVIARGAAKGKAGDASIRNQKHLKDLTWSDSCGACKTMEGFANGSHWKGKAKVSSIQSIDWTDVPEEDVAALCSVYNHTHVYTYDVAHVVMGAALGTDSWSLLDSFNATTTLTSTNPADDASSGSDSDSDMAKQKKIARSARAADNLTANKQKRDLKHKDAVVPRHGERVRDKTRRKVEELEKKVRHNNAQLQKQIQDVREEHARLVEQERIRLEVQRRIEEDNLAAALEFERKWKEQDEECYIVSVRSRRKECAVCGDEKDRLEFPVRSSTHRCEHEAQICSECLDSWIASALSEHGVDGVKCPECPEKLAYTDVQQLASEATFQAFDKATILMALSSLPDFAWCLGPNCKNGQLNVENSNFMACASCGYKQCLQHKVSWHSDESCAQYEYRTSGAQARTEEAKTMAMIDTMTLPKDRRPIVISGPSGAGKGTLINKLRTSYPAVFSTTVSHTTRKPRVGEEEGVAYHFVSGAQFQQLIDEDAFIEHTTYSGNQYGTSKATVREQTDRGLVVLLDIELQGVIAVKSTPDINARFVFVQPPTLEVLETRLRGRSSDSDEDIEKRLRQARTELDYASSHPAFHDIVIINDNLTQASQHLNDFIFGKEE